MEGKNHKDEKVIYYSNTFIEENLEQLSLRNKGKNHGALQRKELSRARQNSFPLTCVRLNSFKLKHSNCD